MVADGYWLQAAGCEWHRVTLADFVAAMTSTGLFPPGSIGGLVGGAPRDFKTDNLRGTTTDPNLGPREIPRYAVDGRTVDRTLTDGDIAEITTRLAAAFAPIVQYAQQFATSLLAALEPMSKFMQEATRCQEADPPAPTPTSGEPTNTPLGPGWLSKPASDAGSPTGGPSTN